MFTFVLPAGSYWIAEKKGRGLFMFLRVAMYLAQESKLVIGVYFCNKK